MSLQTVIYGPDGEQLEQHSVAQHRLGTQLILPDARVFRYCKAAAALGGLMRAAINSNYAPGCTGHANEDGFEGAPSAAVAAGGVSVTFADTTARAKDYYQDGYLVTYPSGHYQMQRIRSSDVGAGTTVTVYLEEELTTAITTSTGLTAYLSPYSAVKAGMSTNQYYEAFVCVPPRPVTSGYYFWGQVRGPCGITPHGGTWPGSAANYRDVFFWIDGTIDPSSVADPTSGYQRAGYLLSSTVSSYGDLFVYLQLD